MTTQMPYLPQPMTLLEAVNLLLESIGVAPVSSLLQEETNVDVETALRSIHTTSMSVQAAGWDFNTEEEMVLDPDPETGEITFPSNALRVDASGTDRYVPIVARGRRLYDKRLKSFSIGRPITVDMVLGLNFEDMSQTARSYVTVKAARSFAQGRLADPLTERFTKDQEAAALVAMEAEEDQSDDRTLFDKNPHLRRRARTRRRT